MPLASPALRLTLETAALVHNYLWLSARSAPATTGAAVKADGYGLGAREVVTRLAAAGCRDFFVASWAEAEALQPWSEGLALSVLHGVREADMAAALSLPARPVLNSAAQVTRWMTAGAGRPCDVMVDTGMNRLGLTAAEARSGLLDGLAIETLMSHLACADEPGYPMNERQRAAFADLAAAIPATRYSLANSAGVCLGVGYAFDLTRPGLALYGGIPAPGLEDGIRPVVALEAEVLQLRTALPGDTIGYGASFKVTRPMRLAVLNLGYADGFLRALAPHTVVRAGGGPLAIVGRVSMDLVIVDLADADVAEGDWLTVDYDLPRLAAASGLSPYELLTNLAGRFDRRWV